MGDLIGHGGEATPTTNYVEEAATLKSNDSCINRVQFS